MFAKLTFVPRNTMFESSTDYEYLTSTVSLEVYKNRFFYSLYDGHIIEFNRNAIDNILIDDETNKIKMQIKSIGGKPDVLNNVFNSATLSRLHDLNIEVHIDKVSELSIFRPYNIKEVIQLTLDSEFPEEARSNEFSIILYAHIDNVFCEIYFSNSDKFILNSSVYQHVITVNPHEQKIYYDDNQYDFSNFEFIRFEISRRFSLYFVYNLVSLHIVQGVLENDVQNKGISSHNICIGTNAGNMLETDKNICIGTNAGSNVKHNNNVIICSDYDERISSDIDNTVIIGNHDTFDKYTHVSNVLHIHDSIHAHEGKVYIHDVLVLGNVSTDVNGCNGMLKYNGNELQFMTNNQWKTLVFR